MRKASAHSKSAPSQKPAPAPKPAAKNPVPMRTSTPPKESTPSSANECAICYEDMDPSAALVPCGHAFCAGCADRIVAANDPCPRCREAVSACMRIYM
jgi:hypothetical protein